MRGDSTVRTARSRARRNLTVVAVIATAVAGLSVGAINKAVAGTVLVDRGNDGLPGDNYADTPTMSRDGRFIGFTSQAANLTPTPTFGRAEMYLLDRLAGTTDLVSVAADGTASNANANFASISDDGNVVAFSSPATNLDPNTRCEFADEVCSGTYARNRSTNTTVLVSKSWNGDPADGQSGDFADITADGRYVVFSSRATNLVPGDTNGTEDIFLRDLATDTTTLLSVDLNGGQGDAQSWEPVISGDGRYVAFSSAATNLAPGGTASGAVYVIDRQLGTIEARGTNGVNDNGSYTPSISDDGRLLTYFSYSQLIPEDTNPSYDLYLEDRTTDQRSLINTDANGAIGINSDMAHLSADGAYVMFRTGAALRTGDTPGTNHYYRRRVSDGQIELISATDDGREIQTGSAIVQRTISADGRFATFAAIDGTVVSNDVNNVSNIFVHDFGAPTEMVLGTTTADTDTELDGATYLDPIETAVTGPAGSSVSITETDPSQILPAGFVALGMQAGVHVTPGGTVADPIVLTFRFDTSLLPPGGDASSVHLFRNGSEVPDCTSPPSAVPDPCVSDRTQLGDGDVVVTARSSSASAWNGALVPPRDTTKPQIGIYPPAVGGTYVQGQVVNAQFGCTDDFGPSGLSCVGDVPNGTPFDTETVGPHTFHVTSTDAAGNTMTATIDYTVISDEFVQIGNTTVSEGDSADARVASFSVTLNKPANRTVTVHWATADGSATAGDYTTRSGTLKFTPSARTGLTATTKLVNVPVLGDTTDEGDEYFTVGLSAVTGGYHLGNSSTGYGILADDDTTAGLRVGVGDATILEGDTAVTNVAKVWVSLSSPVTGATPMSVRLTVVPQDATSGVDYTPLKSRTLVFMPGQWRKAVTIAVLADTIPEGWESVHLVLSAPTAGLAIARDTGSFTIANDD